MSKRKYMDSVRNGNRPFKRTKPTARDRARSRVTTIVRAPGPIPPRAIVKMKYVEEIVSNGASIDYMWNLNSTFDPNRTGTGHQPYGRDTYAGLYGRYRVFAVSYRIVLSTTSNTAARMVLVWNNDSSSYTNYTLAAENPKSLLKTATANAGEIVVKGHLNLANIVGVTRATYKSDDRYQAAYNADPAENIILHTIMCNADGTALSSNAGYMQVCLTYHVEWFDQFDLAQS